MQVRRTDDVYNLPVIGGISNGAFIYSSDVMQSIVAQMRGSSNTIQQLQDDLTESNKKLQNLTAENEHLKKELKQAQDSNFLLNMGKNLLENKAENQKRDSEQLQKELKQAQDLNSKLREEKIRAEARIEFLGEQIRDLKFQLKSTSNELNRLYFFCGTLVDNRDVAQLAWFTNGVATACKWGIVPPKLRKLLTKYPNSKSIAETVEDVESRLSILMSDLQQNSDLKNFQPPEPDAP